MLLVFCFVLVLLVPVVLFVITLAFRHACVLCGLPKPSVMTAFGVMLLIWVSKTVCEAVMDAIVMDSARAAGLPRWEAGIIVIFLFLPVDLLISAALHAGLMNIKFGKGIEVWFVYNLMLLSVVAAVVFVGTLVYLVFNA
jgi:hypothetical protein